ncbi:MAG: bactofilin family protein [Polynucleobacter sp.]
MFFKPKNIAPPISVDFENFDTLIGGSTKIYGRVVAETDLRIDGLVIGDIECDDKNNAITVALGDTGRVEGDIHAHRVLIAGVVEGSVYSMDRVELRPGAQVNGDITYGQLQIDSGAKVSGLLISRFGNKPTGPHDPAMLVLGG